MKKLLVQRESAKCAFAVKISNCLVKGSSVDLPEIPWAHADRGLSDLFD